MYALAEKGVWPPAAAARLRRRDRTNRAAVAARRWPVVENRLLRLIDGADQPPTARQLSQIVRLHEGNVRKHLITLERDGFVVRQRTPWAGLGAGRAPHCWLVTAAGARRLEEVTAKAS